MILSNQVKCRKIWSEQISLHIKKMHVDPRRLMNWRAFWLTLAWASKGFTAAGQRRNHTVLSPFPSQADPWETRNRTLARFHQMRIIFISSFQTVSPMALGPLPSLIDTHPLPTKQNIEAVGFMHGHANAQCHWAQALDRSVRMSSPEQMPRRLFSWNRPSQEL